MSQGTRRLHALALGVALAFPGAPFAVELGAQVDATELPGLDGGRERLVVRGAAAHVLVFVKPNHPHCVEALRELASRERMHEGVRWLAILPQDTSLADARALASATGIRMPLALDPGDRLYAKLGIALHPTLVILDRGGRVAASVPYRAVNFGDRVTAHVRFTLGEISEAELAQATDPGKTEDHFEDGAARRYEQFGARLLEQGQLDLALAQVSKSLAAAPTASAYCLQGKILGRMGRRAESTRSLDAAVRLDPSYGQAVADNVPCPLARIPR
jgi:tetratricopeptide (TPR) repeat protein